ncbi:MAG: preprotein translocase subunit SecY [Clostridia bacterium]|nr:preprotein translocase subunit SecY [Clostridia bacterium]
MLETFKNAWRIEELRKKILFTLLILFLYRIGASFIPVPGVNTAIISEMVNSYDILGFLNLITGGSFEGFTIFAVGISPHITSSIVMQLLSFAIPSLERLSKEGGEEGRKKIQRITRYVSVGLAFMMSIGMVFSLRSSLLTATFLSMATVVCTLTAGSMIVMWMGEKITEKGIGNGVSMIIFIGIVSRLPVTVVSLVANIINGTTTFWVLLPLVVIVVALFAGIVLIDSAERRIPVQYAKRVVGRRLYGGQSTHIPMKLNSAGVMPIIFAMTLLQVPAMICQFWPTSSFTIWYMKWLGSGTIIYSVLFAVMIVALGFFYNAITFNAPEIGKNLQQNGGFIPGIRPGRPTSEYLSTINTRLTMFGGMFLAVLATIPSLVIGLFVDSFALTATGLLISVSVALETTKQLESMMLMRHYKGFLNK